MERAIDSGNGPHIGKDQGQRPRLRESEALTSLESYFVLFRPGFTSSILSILDSPVRPVSGTAL